VDKVEQSDGFELIEFKMLPLDPFNPATGMGTEEEMVEARYEDIIEHLDNLGDYGNAQSLAVLGLQHLIGGKQIKKDIGKAKEFFERCLGVDKEEASSNYYLGLIYMLGLGGT